MRPALVAPHFPAPQSGRDCLLPMRHLGQVDETLKRADPASDFVASSSQASPSQQPRRNTSRLLDVCSATAQPRRPAAWDGFKRPIARRSSSPAGHARIVPTPNWNTALPIGSAGRLTPQRATPRKLGRGRRQGNGRRRRRRPKTDASGRREWTQVSSH